MLYMLSVTSKPSMPSVGMLNAIMLNVIMLNVIMLNVILLSVGMLNVGMLSVAAPCFNQIFLKEGKLGRVFQLSSWPHLSRAQNILFSKTVRLKVEKQAREH